MSLIATSNGPLTEVEKEICKIQQEPQIAFGVVMIALIIIGLVGNILVIVTILLLQEFKKSVTNWYILQLALADTLFLAMLSLTAQSSIIGRWIHPEWVCKFKEGVIFINYYASIYFLVVMSLDRYLAVTKAFASSTWVTSLRSPIASYIISIVGWSASILACIILYQNAKVNDCQICGFDFGHLSNIPTSQHVTASQTTNENFTEINVNMTSPEGDENTIDFSENLDEFEAGFFDYELPYEVLRQIYEDYLNEAMKRSQSTASPDVKPTAPTLSGEEEETTSTEGLKYVLTFHRFCKHTNQPTLFVWLWTNFIIAFLIPLFLISFFYGMIISTIMKAKSVGNSESQRTYRRKVTMIVLGLVILFVVSWSPWYIVKIAQIYGIDLGLEACRTLVDAVRAIAYLNSALNPYFYSFLGSHFRDRLMRAGKKVRIPSTKGSRLSSGGSGRRRRKWSTSNSGSNKQVRMQCVKQGEAPKEEELMVQSTAQKTERTILPIV
ncbi:unnamed protein product [Clavelina lepadiformis]|uniref:G-protein coupled receptors family 1 profile domain-containing protein n=1 Tax=Clavelina lepadiformis TaxID=159417 RepID=A0ABP0GR24_CLALP